MNQEHEKESRLIFLFIVALIAYYFIGCCATPQTIINERVDTLYVPVPSTTDNLTILDKEPIGDTTKLAEGGKTTIMYITNPKDSVEVILLRKRLNELGRLLANRDADTVKVYYEWKDTVQVVGNKPDEGSWLERQIWKLIVIVLCLAGAVIVVRKAVGI